MLANYTQFWNNYADDILRLSWNVALFYYHCYGNSAGSEKFEITIFDFDRMSTEDKLGKVKLPAEASCGKYDVIRRRQRTYVKYSLVQLNTVTFKNCALIFKA